MNRLTNILNRAPIAPSDSTAASPARDAGTPAPLARGNGARNLNLPAPIGKREKAKRLLSAAFSVSAKPAELEGPVRRHAKAATSKRTQPQQVLTPATPSPTLQERLAALRQEPKERASAQSSRPTDIDGTELSDDEIKQRDIEAEKQYYGWS